MATQPTTNSGPDTGASGGISGPPSAIDISKLPKDSRAHTVVGVTAMCVALGTVSVAARLYTRQFIVRKLGIDDAMAVLSLVSLVAIGVAEIMNVQSGLGTHIYLIRTPNPLVNFLRDFWFGLVFYNVALLFIKMTFLFQYYRVVSQVRNLRIGYIISMVVIGGWTVSQIFIVIFSCIPVNKFWDPNVKGKCFDNAVEQNLNPIGNIITDFLVLVLPLPVIFRLNLGKPQKLALLGIFCLGFLTCIISIMRRIFLNFTSDLTYSAVDVTLWSTAEVTSGILCASLPTLRPLMGRFFPSLSGTIGKLSSYRRTKDTRSTVSSSFGSSWADQSWRRSPGWTKGDLEKGGLEMGPGHQRWKDVRNKPLPVVKEEEMYSVAKPKSAKVYGGSPSRDWLPRDVRMIGGKPTQISWPVEVSTSISGSAERPGTAKSTAGSITVNRELRVESYREAPPLRYGS